jgi:hypothetical protein
MKIKPEASVQFDLQSLAQIAICAALEMPGFKERPQLHVEAIYSENDVFMGLRVYCAPKELV